MSPVSRAEHRPVDDGAPERPAPSGSSSGRGTTLAGRGAGSPGPSAVDPDAPPEDEVGPAPGTVGPGRLRTVPAHLVALAAGLGTLVAIDAWWLDRFRASSALNIDEAGYLTFAMADERALRTGGLSALWHAVETSKLQAPLGPLLTLPFHLLFGTSLRDGFALSLVLLVALGVVTYLLARTVLSEWWAVLAALVVCASPGVTNDARDFLLAMPLAVTFTAAIWALVRSEGLSRTGWAVAGGVLLGLATLSRTMGLGFVAGPVLATGLQAVVLRPHPRRILNGAAMVVVGVATAATWYVASFTTVWPYLNGRGPYYTEPPPPPGQHTHGQGWSVTLHALVRDELFVPLSAALVLCLVFGAVSVVLRRAGRRGPDGPEVRKGTVSADTLRRLVGGAAFVPAVCLVEAWVSLSGAKPSVAQWLPVLPALVVCALASVARVRWTGVRWALAALLGVVIVLDTAMSSDTVSWLSGTESVPVPVVGSVPVIDGSSDLRSYLEGSGQPVGPVTGPAPPPADEWLPASRRVAGWILAFSDAHHVSPVVAFASRDQLFNTNTVALEGFLGSGQTIATSQLLTTRGGDRVAAYREQLSAPRYGEPNLFVTVDPSPSEYRPQVTQAYAVGAAASLGFEPVHAFTLPDGRHGEIWWLPR
jgi:4-amino-4-deoxy-L-arabinose transferase-like glycosyltransferase